MWNLKYDTNEPIYKTEKLSDIENRLVVAGGRRGWIGRLLDKQQGATIQHRELYSISCDNHDGKECLNVYVCVRVCVCVCV